MKSPDHAQNNFFHLLLFFYYTAKAQIFQIVLFCDKLRINYLIYGVGLSVSETETKNAIKTADELVKKIEKYYKSL